MAELIREGYHSSNGSSWRRGSGISGRKIGVELEVIARGQSSYRSLLNLLPDDLEQGVDLDVEEDGSLPGSSGCELVFPPVDYATIRQGLCNLGRSMDALSGHIREDRERSAAGMHMNVNRTGWSERKVAYFVATVHNMPEIWLENLGGRSLTSYCAQMRNYYQGILAHATGPGGHGNAAEPKGTRVELRFPRSTANKARLAALVHFVEVLEDFAEELDTGDYEQPTCAEIGTLFQQYVEALALEDDDITDLLSWFNGEHNSD